MSSRRRITNPPLYGTQAGEMLQAAEPPRRRGSRGGGTDETRQRFRPRAKASKRNSIFTPLLIVPLLRSVQPATTARQLRKHGNISCGELLRQRPGALEVGAPERCEGGFKTGAVKFACFVSSHSTGI